MRREKNIKGTLTFRALLLLVFLSFFLFFGGLFFGRSAYACHSCSCNVCCPVVSAAHAILQAAIVAEHVHLRVEVFGFTAGILPFPAVPTPPAGFNRLQWHERFLIEDFFKPYIQPAMMMMTEQLVSVAMEQMFIVGTFFDAKMQLETQMKFQELAARAHKDYQPSFGMCEIGTSTRSLAASQFNGDFSKMVLNRRFVDRQLGNNDSVGGGGPDFDRASDRINQTPTPHNRLGYFLHNTCDDNDLNKQNGNNQTGLFLCAQNPPNNGWVNRDIDWNNTVMSPRTINVDFNLDASDNSRLFEMSNMLYGHQVFSRPDGTLLRFERNHNVFLDSRAVTAKRNVAQNSFNSIVGLKTRGSSEGDFNSTDTAEFMRFFMEELGFPANDLPAYHRYMFHKTDANESGMSPDDNPISYYGQMEVLAKKIYQRPEFYTNLYDKPANVKRKSAAMQAIKLMLDRDIFDSQLRSEAILSMILELKVVEEQQAIENYFGLIKEETR